MFAFQRISTAEARKLVHGQDANLIDIRDDVSFQNSRVKNAIQITSANMQDFMDEANKSSPLVIYCYHGNSSQQAANYFAAQGFASVYSVDGGYEHWAQDFPLDIDREMARG